MTEGASLTPAGPTDTSPFPSGGNDAKRAMIALVRSLAVQQARQDHNGSKDDEASRDLRPVFLGSAE